MDRFFGLCHCVSRMHCAFLGQIHIWCVWYVGLPEVYDRCEQATHVLGGIYVSCDMHVCLYMKLSINADLAWGNNFFVHVCQCAEMCTCTYIYIYIYIRIYIYIYIHITPITYIGLPKLSKESAQSFCIHMHQWHNVMTLQKGTYFHIWMKMHWRPQIASLQM